jgi:hypothetical protein
MIDGKALSAIIRKKKMGALRQDMDWAGQEAVDPNVAWDAKQAAEVDDALDEPEIQSASPEEMGEHDSSQDVARLKVALARINKYFDSLL